MKLPLKFVSGMTAYEATHGTAEEYRDCLSGGRAILGSAKEVVFPNFPPRKIGDLGRMAVGTPTNAFSLELVELLIRGRSFWISIEPLDILISLTFLLDKTPLGLCRSR